MKREFGGVPLADHLYPDSRGRVGYWRYRRPDRTFRTFRAADVHEANAIAEDGNRRRALSLLDRSSMAYAVARYVEHAERLRPSLRAKESWRNRCYAMRQFAAAFPRRTVTERELWSWWDGLTHSQQILREAEFRRMWAYLMREQLVTTDANPFDRDRLLRREKPVSARERLTLDAFWRIYAAAPDGLRVAMGVSLLTTLRRGDVVAIERRHIQDGCLRITVSKSAEQRGEIRAARLEWRLADHPELAELIERGLAQGAGSGCPFVVCMRPKTWRMNGKAHSWQVLPDRLSKEFARARVVAGVGGENPPTFHEIRSLGSALLAAQGEELTDVMELMGHADAQMTRLYQSGHPLPYQRVGIRVRTEGAW